MEKVTVQCTVQQPIQKVWERFTEANHITHWNFASPEWHCPKASSDLQVGGTFNYRMEARDGSMGFDFEGKFIELDAPKRLAYELGDQRKVEVTFEEKDGQTVVTETFEAETENPIDMQQAGWQGILNNFKVYAESE